MRLREQEVLEEFAVSGKLNILLSEKPPIDKRLAVKVVNLLQPLLTGKIDIPDVSNRTRGFLCSDYRVGKLAR